MREAQRPELLGVSAEQRAVVQQWLEYRATRLDGCPKEEVRSVLKVGGLLLPTPPAAVSDENWEIQAAWLTSGISSTCFPPGHW